MGAGRMSMRVLAAKAGVSPATVSLALRSHPRISEATRLRIQKLAEELGYKPSPMVKSLMKTVRQRQPLRDGSTIAMVVNVSKRREPGTWVYHKRFFEPARERAESLGFGFHLINLSDAQMGEELALRMIQNRGYRGVLLLRPGLRFEEASRQLRIPMVAIAPLELRKDIHTVNNNQYLITRELISRVAELGYRRIGCLIDAFWVQSLNNSYQAAVLSMREELKPKVRVFYLMGDSRSPRKVIHELLHVRFPAWIREKRLDCVLGNFSKQARKDFARLGFQVPEELGYAFFDLFEGDRESAGMRQDYEQVSRSAIEHLDGLISRHQLAEGLEGEEAGHTLIPARFQLGSSLQVQR